MTHEPESLDDPRVASEASASADGAPDDADGGGDEYPYDGVTAADLEWILGRPRA